MRRYAPDRTVVGVQAPDPFASRRNQRWSRRILGAREFTPPFTGRATQAVIRGRARGCDLRSGAHCLEVRAMLVSMPSFTLPNPALVRTVRLRRPAAQLSRSAPSTIVTTGCKLIQIAD